MLLNILDKYTVESIVVYHMVGYRRLQIMV
jgi:hypothetical protein